MIAALVGGFFWPGVANADVCRDQWGRSASQLEWSAWLADLERRDNGTLERRTMTDAERLRFLRAYNNAPPVSEHNPERIEMFLVEWNSILVAVVFVEDGCVTLTAVLFRTLVESIISPNTNGHGRSLRPAGREA